MPNIKTVHKLRDISLKFVCDNSWILEQLERSSSNEIILPNIISEDIFYELKKSKNLSRRNIDLLLSQNTTRANLSDLPADLFRRGITLIRNQSSHLKHLDISRTDIISRTAINVLFKSIPYIESLNTAYTNVSNEALLTLRKRCPYLKNIDLTGCYKVTNVGLNHLMLARNERSLPIQQLFINQTAITHEAALSALYSLPNLDILEYTFDLNSIRGFVSTYHSSLPSLNLKNLVVEFIDYNDTEHFFQPPNANSTFQNVFAKLCLINLNTHTTNISLLDNVIECTKLKKVGITNVDGNPEVKFPGKLQSFLSSDAGFNLTNLSLSEVNGVCLTTVGLNCPQLIDLDLANNSYIEMREINEKRLSSGFKKLEVLSIVAGADEHKFFPIRDLTIIMRQCLKIRKLSFYDCFALSDSLLTNAFSINKFRKLKTLELYYCDNFGLQTIVKLLHLSNDLEMVRLRRCKKIDVSSNEALQTEILNNNLATIIDWK